VNNPNVYIDWTYPQNSGVWGRYTSLEDPQAPMINSRGRFIPYLRHPEGRLVAYLTTDDEVRQHMYKTINLAGAEVVTNGYTIPQRRAFPRFLKIFTQ